jgi:hypothetical protein
MPSHTFMAYRKSISWSWQPKPISSVSMKKTTLIHQTNDAMTRVTGGACRHVEAADGR